MDEQQVKQIDNLLKSSTLDESSRELMRDFLNSLVDQPQFEKIVGLLDRFPALFENFSKCFQLKKGFFESIKIRYRMARIFSERKGYFGYLIFLVFECPKIGAFFVYPQ